MVKIYQRIARLIQAIKNCEQSGNWEWEGRHTETVESIAKNGPSGSGIDSGTRINVEKSTPNKIVIETSFHHMNDGGYYDGWTGHVITVQPSLAYGFTLFISGRNRNEIKDYLHDVYSQWLDSEVAE